MRSLHSLSQPAVQCPDTGRWKEPKLPLGENLLVCSLPRGAAARGGRGEKKLYTCVQVDEVVLSEGCGCEPEGLGAEKQAQTDGTVRKKDGHHHKGEELGSRNLSTSEIDS